jgi:hypothetical protein
MFRYTSVSNHDGRVWESIASLFLAVKIPFGAPLPSGIERQHEHAGHPCIVISKR